MCGVPRPSLKSQTQALTLSVSESYSTHMKIWRFPSAEFLGMERHVFLCVLWVDVLSGVPIQKVLPHDIRVSKSWQKINK